MSNPLLQRCTGVVNAKSREALEEVARVLWSRSTLGYEMDERGGVRIGWVARNQPALWFHLIPAAPSGEQVSEVEKRQGFSLPDEFRIFLLTFNGAILFRAQFGSAHLGFGGIVKNEDRFNRLLVNAQNIELDNYYARLRGLPDGAWEIGRYAWDGSYICIDKGGSVYWRTHASDDRLREWCTFNQYLLEEVARLDNYFDEQCMPKKAEWPSIPTLLV
jgi:SMI1 / KNR4 family (SUKH-1)